MYLNVDAQFAVKFKTNTSISIICVRRALLATFFNDAPFRQCLCMYVCMCVSALCDTVTAIVQLIHIDIAAKNLHVILSLIILWLTLIPFASNIVKEK